MPQDESLSSGWLWNIPLSGYRPYMVDGNGSELTTAVVLLDPRSDEHATVLCHFLSTNRLEDVDVIRIFRIQSSFLWSHYTLKKAEMQHERGGEEVEERQLFHGTKYSNIDAICRKGFDWRLCGRHGIKFGQGCYFALCSGYSHVYSPKTGVMHTPSLLLSHPLPHKPFNSLQTSSCGGDVGRDDSWDREPVPLLKGTLATYEAGLKNLQILLAQVEILLPKTWSPAVTAQSSCPNAFPLPPSASSSSASPSSASSSHFTSSSPFQSSSSSQGPSSFLSAAGPSFVNSAPGSVFGASTTFLRGQSNTSGVFGAPIPGAVFGTPSPSFGSTVGTPSPSFGGTFSTPSPSFGGTFGTPSPSFGSAPSPSFGAVEGGQMGRDFRYMFMARVLVGRSVRGHKDYRRPPSINPGEPYGPCFDSCVDDPLRPSIFVIFDSSQAYPEYVLEYKARSDVPRC